MYQISLTWFPYKSLPSNLGGGNSNIFYFHPHLGEVIQFDEHIFQMGWFNHQLVLYQIWVLLMVFNKNMMYHPSSHNHGSGKWHVSKYEFPFPSNLSHVGELGQSLTGVESSYHLVK